MEFEGEFTVDGRPDELWKYFTDPEILQDCAPGCQSMTLESPSELTTTLAVGVGSVKPTFDVEAVVTECTRPEQLEIRASGEASRNSFDVTARQELRDNGDGTTTVAWRADAQVSGLIASMGERALGSVADTLVTDFFRKLEDHVNAGTPAESRIRAADSAAPVSGAGGPETEATASADTERPRAGDTPGLTDGPSGGSDRGPAVYVAAGVAVGAVATALRDRLRDGPSGDDGSGRSRESLLTFLLGLAVGAGGVALWDRSSRGDGRDRLAGAAGDREHPPTTDTTDGAGSSGRDAAPDAVGGDGQKLSTDADGSPVDGNRQETDAANEDGDEDEDGIGSSDPLDRLESR